MKKTLALILLFLFISDNIQSQIQKNVNKEKIYNSSLQSPLKKQQVQQKSTKRIQIEQEIKYLRENSTNTATQLNTDNSNNLIDLKKSQLKSKTNLIANSPVNISVANATLINKSPFLEEGINISEAPISNGGFTSCNLEGFNVVYYKFTAESANTSAYVNLYNEDWQALAENTSFAIFYTAESLNATSESELTPVSECTFGDFTEIVLTKDTTYYIAIYREGNDKTNISIRIPLDVSDEEKTILSDLYNSTNGDNWMVKNNWNSEEPVSNWQGITVEEGKVQTIRIYGNNLEGNIPESIGNLTGLESLDIAINLLSGPLPNSLENLTNLKELRLQQNQLSGTIPNFTGLNLTTFWIADNLYQFGDLEPNFNNYNTNIPDFWYTPGIKPEITLDGSEIVSIGDNRQLSINTSGTNNVYAWYKGSTLLGESTDGTWNLQNLQITDFGSYTCRVTNTIVINTTIFSNEVFIGDTTDPTTSPDYDALVSFFYSTDAASWLDSSNWLSTEPLYKWKGVVVDENNKVIEISLPSNNLMGTIPNDIENLDALKKLNLGGNKITGTIPTVIGNLTNLEYLRLTSNVFTGTIPATIGNLTNLEYLSLSINQLTGNIPSELGNLVNLEILAFNNTLISGSIPKELGELTKLKSLQLWGGNLTGNIPPELGNLTSLERLYIIEQQVTGAIPKELGNLTNCEQFVLWNNELTGEIPKELGNLSKANLIYLNENNLTGNIPTELNTIASLETLLLDNNNLSGSVPNFSANSLQALYISNNNIFFDDLETNHTNNLSIENYIYSPQNKTSEDVTHQLIISDNITFDATITGNNNQYQWYKDEVLQDGFTNPILNITNIQINQFGDYVCKITHPTITGLVLETGTYTITIKDEDHPDYNALIALYNATNGANWTNSWDINTPIISWFGLTFNANNRVSAINLNDNNVTGSLPPEIGTLNELRVFNIDNSNLTGNIPSEIGNLTKLEEIVLGSGQLTGSIPKEIGNLKELKFLILDNNNSLSGELPFEIGNLTKLEALNLYSNNFSGELPSSFENLVKLKFLDLAKSNFEGKLPDFSNINLQYLDLKENYFDFTDLKSLVTYSKNINQFYYSPQKTRDEAIETTLAIGEDVTIIVDDQGINRDVSEQKNAEGNLYTWVKNDNIINNANAVTNTLNLTNVTENDNGVYYCVINNPTLPDLTITRAAVTILIDATASLEDENLLENVSFHPNPVNNRFTIKIQKLETAKIVIYDVNGKQVLNKNLKTKQEEINISTLKNGVYILSITSNNKSINKKLIKI
jgi:Leucine-rich repeat (LRR) protein